MMSSPSTCVSRLGGLEPPSGIVPSIIAAAAAAAAASDHEEEDK